MTIETALISAPSRSANVIFGRPLLERVILACQRAGIRRVLVQVPSARRSEIASLIGTFRSHPEVTLVDDLRDATAKDVDQQAPCIAFAGNLVFSRLELGDVLEKSAVHLDRVMRFSSSDPEAGGEIVTGPLGALLRDGGIRTEPTHQPSGALPFALNGRPEDRVEAEVRLARSLRHQTVTTDALMARIFDRKISWRLSLRLARTRITPNQVTLANTLLGFLCAWMFAMPSYWWRLAASILFIASITIDGVDGELARLQMSETDWGGKLDVITDNIVHVAIFAGVFIGAYRASANPVFLHLMWIQLGGFAMAGLSTFLAFRSQRGKVEDWIQRVDRFTGRDFAYLLLGFALFNHLQWFCWATAFGTYVFALGLMWLTFRPRKYQSSAVPHGVDAPGAVEEA